MFDTDVMNIYLTWPISCMLHMVEWTFITFVFLVMHCIGLLLEFCWGLFLYCLFPKTHWSKNPGFLCLWRCVTSCYLNLLSRSSPVRLRLSIVCLKVPCALTVDRSFSVYTRIKQRAFQGTLWVRPVWLGEWVVGLRHETRGPLPT